MIAKLRIPLLVALCGAVLIAFKKKDPKVGLTEIAIKAPFEMPAIKVPDFKECPRLTITQFGAKSGDKAKTSKAIEKAITRANRIGGGVVIVPRGEWLTGKVHLQSNVNLHLEKGAVLLFSENPDDYLPAVHSSWEGMECYNYSPLIYAYQCTNVAITGHGEIKAKMDIWKQWFSRPKPHMESLKYLYDQMWRQPDVSQRQMVNDTAHLRPQFIQFNRSENILLDGVTITNSPFWTIHPYLCKNVVIRNIKVYAHGHNNDGVDPEMSQNVLIENCVFDQGNDAIAIKAGRAPDGWRMNTPSKNIVIRNNIVKNGHQLVAIGSELSGGIENIFVDSCTVADGAKLNHLIFIKTNERMGGYVKNVYVSNIRSGKKDLGVLGIETDVLYQWRNLVPTYERKLTPIQDVYLENIEVDDVKFVSRILGQAELPVRNVSLKNINASSVRETTHIHENAVNVAATDHNSNKERYQSYLFTYFTGNSKNAEAIRFALSDDGYTYKALNGNNPVVRSADISLTGGVRDPHILRAEDRKTFYMVATDMVASSGWDSNRGVVLMKSTDLINWQSSAIHFPKRFAGNDSLMRVWAPQTIYDASQKKYMIYFSMKHGKRGADKIYYAYANDEFTDFTTEPKQLFHHPNNISCIDGDIVHAFGKYQLFFKTEGSGKGIMKAVSDQLTEGYVMQDRYLQPTTEHVEGSGIFTLNDSEDYILMYDVYKKGRYQFTKSRDLEKFEVIDEQMTMDFHPRHGTVISITKEEADRLRKQWP
jgi:hypothetical protein